MVDDFHLSDGQIAVDGWFLSPFHPVASARFLVNSRHFLAPNSYHPAFGDVRAIVPDLPPSAYRFSVRFAYTDDTPFVSLEFLPSGYFDDDRITNNGWWLLASSQEDDPLPKGDNIYRVIGNRNALHYRLGGATVANRINSYLLRTYGKSVAELGPVLDWGCGCARVSRYLRKLGCEGSLHGVDVDPANVDWCRQNLPWFPIRLSPLNPPLPFPDQSFGLIIGISVFTHLREDVQFAWLTELARLLRPGGLAMVSVMGAPQIALQGGSSEAIRKIEHEKFILEDNNDQLYLGDGSENYYVNVYHSSQYIYEHWQNEMEIVDIVPFLAAHQNIVVLRKK
ncbi:class I SAM-dependent methyltransferase [Methylocella sp. CPCC 101449]|uniref:class I SAM-dependent methyltransferase n=1 Tax=Methylocella sp. CPCC 101449 TaxID=2987531 RepID=UPI00288D93A0|nr:class I SAM-dependent methyltransferase [Methylocella sp. CPCC 101449]MDT2019459.1 class I SAM-dependent methyltransferase [Methylocella sp. CPCC 101449]